ncbi:PIN domain-containing protein [bacterium CPR1]|nr:PIN domain-containing protein [bacterium CPR1]
MPLSDSNVLFALLVGSHPHSNRARTWMDSQVEPDSVVLCRAVQLTLLRLLTSHSILPAYGLRPLSNQKAWELVIGLLEDERLVFFEEPEDLERHWLSYAARPTASAKLWMDAYLAAFARAAGHQLVTLDKAFRQFDGLDLLVLQEGSSPS